MKIKAISLHEPWASLIRCGAKRWETRTWSTKYRGKLLICAARGGLSQAQVNHMLSFWHMQGGLAPLVGKPLDLSFRSWPGVEIEHLNFGQAVAIVELIECKRVEDCTIGEIGKDMYYGNFKPGRFGWKLELAEPIEPFPVKGKQGLFEVEISR